MLRRGLRVGGFRVKGLGFRGLMFGGAQGLPCSHFVAHGFPVEPGQDSKAFANVAASSFSPAGPISVDMGP